MEQPLSWGEGRNIEDLRDVEDQMQWESTSTIGAEGSASDSPAVYTVESAKLYLKVSWGKWRQHVKELLLTWQNVQLKISMILKSSGHESPPLVRKQDRVTNVGLTPEFSVL